MITPPSVVIPVTLYPWSHILRADLQHSHLDYKILHLRFSARYGIRQWSSEKYVPIMRRYFNADIFIVQEDEESK